MPQLWRARTLFLRLHRAGAVLEGGWSDEVFTADDLEVSSSSSSSGGGSGSGSGKKVSNVHDPLHDNLDRSVSDSVNRHSEKRTVRFSEHDQINFLDEYLERLRTTKTERLKTEIFRVGIKSHSNMFGSDHILLDTCAGESVFNNKHLFYSIYNSDKPLSVSGVNAKGKPLVITQYVDTDFRTVYYDSDCIANILSFGNMVNNSRSVSYTQKHDCCTLQMRDRGCCYYFTRDKSSNIYICDLNTMVSKPKVMLVTTVRDKILKYTQRHTKQAELAREYKRKLGYASTGQLIKLISQGKIANCNIAAQDVVRALDIWGPDLGSLKGETVSQTVE